jgi:hypothetical protein
MRKKTMSARRPLHGRQGVLRYTAGMTLKIEDDPIKRSEQRLQHGAWLQQQ